MAIPIMILGDSGSGKSATMRNCKRGQIGVINVAGKPLPFKNDLQTVATDSYKKITELLLSSKADVIVIDDAQYLLTNEFMRRSNEIGFQKFTDMAKNYWSLIAETICKQMPPHKRVYFFSHIDRDQNGFEKVKTVGKLLDEKITVEGLFTIVLKTHVEDGKYTLRTQTNGMDTVKTPIGMFDTNEIDNDLLIVDKAICEYYNLNNNDVKGEEQNND